MNTNTTNNTKATANTNDVKAIVNEILNSDEIMEIIVKAARKAAKKDKFNKKGFRKELKKLTIGDVNVDAKLDLNALNNNKVIFKTGDININVASDWKNDMPITSHILSDIESQMRGNLTLEDNSKSSNIREQVNN